jgi:hypothetical protein
MNMTLLDIVQKILNDMNSDYVNSINDTEESLQVASIVEDTYYEMMNRRDWPHLKKLVGLESFNDSFYPTYLLLPKGTKKVEWVTYNQKKEHGADDYFAPVKYLHPDEFIQYTNGRNSSNQNVRVVRNTENVPLKIFNDCPPKYWTSFDDTKLFFDSYMSTIEDTLQGVNAQAEVYIFPSWEMRDDFVPNLPMNVFPALLAEAKSSCFYTIKESANEKAEQQSSRQQKWLSFQGWRTHGGIRYPNYGRRSVK